MQPVSVLVKRFGQLALAMVGGVALVGPALAVFAVSKPAVALAMKPPHAVIAVQPFLDIGGHGCMGDDPPLHKGPIEPAGGLFVPSLQSWMDLAALRCLRPGTDDNVVLTVSIDAKGRIDGVETDDDSAPALTTCLESALRGGREKPLREGPARLKIGYFMGRLPR
jgi:hypothetical protein